MWGGGDEEQHDKEGDFDLVETGRKEDKITQQVVQNSGGITIKNEIQINISLGDIQKGDTSTVSSFEVASSSEASVEKEILGGGQMKEGTVPVAVTERVQEILNEVDEVLSTGTKGADEQGYNMSYIVIGVLVGVLLIVIIIALYFRRRNMKSVVRGSKVVQADGRDSWGSRTWRRLKVLCCGSRSEGVAGSKEPGIESSTESGYLTPRRTQLYSGSEDGEFDEISIDAAKPKVITGISNENWVKPEFDDHYYEEVCLDGAEKLGEKFGIESGETTKTMSSARFGINTIIDATFDMNINNNSNRELDGCCGVKFKEMNIDGDKDGQEEMSECGSSLYLPGEDSFMASFGKKVEAAIKDVAAEQKQGKERIAVALREVGEGVEKEKAELYGIMAKVRDLQGTDQETPRRRSRLVRGLQGTGQETPRRSSRLETKRLGTETSKMGE